jgi:polar amino acid transport system substrate-binding protein
MKMKSMGGQFSSGWRIRFLLLASIGGQLAGCAANTVAPSQETRQILAPSGKLRIGLYPGTPTSILPGATPADARGVGHDLGKELARRLGVPSEVVVFSNNAGVLDAVKAGTVDVIFTNASAARAKDMDFTTPYMEIELGYLIPRGSPISSLADVDRPGIRVGVTEKSSSDATLSRDLKQAVVVRAATVKSGAELLATGKIDAYATNKATLFEMSDDLPGSTVLAGRWGVERHAIAIPKGRDQGMPFARMFAEEAKATGFVKAAAARAGLRGLVEGESK